MIAIWRTAPLARSTSCPQASRYTPEHLQAEGQLTAAMGQFRAVVESYPNLKANEQFLRLQGALNECEEQIA